MFLPSVAYHSLIFLKYYLLYGCYMFFKSFYYNSEKKNCKNTHKCFLAIAVLTREYKRFIKISKWLS